MTVTTPRKSEPGKAWAQLVAACGRYLKQPDDTTARRVHAALDHWMAIAHPNRTSPTNPVCTRCLQRPGEQT